MTLVDTSVWVDHLRRGNSRLVRLLQGDEVLTHPFVVGELACGSLARRDETLTLFGTLPKSPVADDEEVLGLLEARRLYGRGLGWIDVHLLASAILGGCPIWTLDKSLADAAQAVGVADSFN